MTHTDKGEIMSLTGTQPCQGGLKPHTSAKNKGKFGDKKGGSRARCPIAANIT